MIRSVIAVAWLGVEAIATAVGAGVTLAVLYVTVRIGLADNRVVEEQNAIVARQGAVAGFDLHLRVLAEWQAPDTRTKRARVAQAKLSGVPVDDRDLGAVLGVLELVGHAVRSEVLSFDLVRTTLSDTILVYERAFRDEISDIQKSHESYWENVCWLADATAARNHERRVAWDDGYPDATVIALTLQSEVQTVGTFGDL